MIFGSVYNFLHNSTYQAFLSKKKKGKHTVLRGRPAWTRPKSAREPSRVTRGRCLSHAATDGWVPLVRPSFLLSLRDADGPVSFFFITHGGSATAPAAVGEGLGPHARAHQHRLAFATALLSPKRALPSPSISATRMAGGRHSRPQAGH